MLVFLQKMGDNNIPQTKSQVSEALLRSFFFDVLSFNNLSELDESSIPSSLENSGLQSLVADIGRHFVPSISHVDQLR
uniref:Uncharacterized protein n=1 Tax=Meloidogyne floridensis TaxID=298350 RepID=A0A915NMX7_9BILA